MTDLLLCVDGSPAGTAATQVAFALALELRAKVHALFVVEDSGLATLVDAALDGHDASERLSEMGEALRTRVEGRAGEMGVAVNWIVDQGEPFERILEHAHDLAPRFIVMGRTGRRGPGRALVGSQVEHVLEFSEWPLIVVPGSNASE